MIAIGMNPGKSKITIHYELAPTFWGGYEFLVLPNNITPSGASFDEATDDVLWYAPIGTIQNGGLSAFMKAAKKFEPSEPIGGKHEADQAKTA